MLSACREYSSRIVDMASDFAVHMINADDARNYITTRKTDEKYQATLRNLREYVNYNQAGIRRISMIQYSDSKGYYIYDTLEQELGTKISYDDYETSIKAELINGRNEWDRTTRDSIFVYRPMRTTDDRLAGYVIVETDNTLYRKYLWIICICYAVLLLIGLVFAKYLSHKMKKEIFTPIQKLAKTAMDFTGVISADTSIDTKELFQIEDEKDNEIGYLGKALQKMVSDINSSTENLARAIYDATHDAMTQVFNKRHYNNMISVFKESSSLCVIYFDVNNLKLMNDTLGHEHGDYVIKKAAEYIQQFTGDSAFCFRMGGDEFLLVIMNYQSFNEINQIIEKLDTDSPYILSPEEDSVKCALSYGYDYAKGSFSFEKLLANAEDRMYDKKTELKKILNMPDR